jgi:hypothetical protein
MATVKSKKKPPELFGGDFLHGSKLGFKVTAHTAKSITLSYGGVNLGKHFGKVIYEHKPS